MAMQEKFVINLAGKRTPAEIHGAIASALPVPEFYGRNLDALHDFLTERCAGAAIVFRNAGAGATALLCPACNAAMSETPGLAITFEPGRRRWRARPSDGRKARGRRVERRD